MKLSAYNTPFDVHLQWFSEEPPGKEEPPTTPPEGGEPPTVTVEELQKQLEDTTKLVKTMQSNFDRKNTDFQKLKEENEELKKAQMKEEERKEYERKKYEQELADKEAALKIKEFELEKTKLNSEKEIPYELGNLVKGDSIEDYIKNIEIISKLIDTRVNAEVEKRINEKLGNNQPPGGGDNGTYPNNPWSKDTFNLTKQGEIYRKDPELAKKMAAAAKKG